MFLFGFFSGRSRVVGAGDPVGATITVIEDPLQAVKDGAIRLCLAV